jgi:NitT/TauT family transport system substrate-binding protein
VTAPASAGARSVVTVKYGSNSNASDGPFFIAQTKGYFAEQGITLETTTQFATSTQIVAPLGQNQLQVGGAVIGSGLLNAIGRGIAIRMVGDRANLNPGHGYQAIVVRTPLADVIQGPADLKGRTYALASPDVSGEVNLATYLRQGGLSVKDLNLVMLPFPDMQAAFESGRIDAADPTEPWLTRILESGAAKLLVRYDEVMPGQQNAVLVFSEPFAADRDAAVRFMVAYLKGVRFYNDAFVKNDPTKRAEAIEILAAATKLDKTLFDKMVMPGILPNGRINVEMLETDQQYFLAKGTQEKAIDLQTAINLSFADEAVRILGPYR